MTQKFFLFKRNDPSTKGGAVFSDNGKGISAITLQANNLAYMAADKGSITMYFNASAPFEENSLTLAGESFEKTSIRVTCEIGREVELMEAIIDFMNRDKTKNVMKFDAIGGTNTFSSISPSPTIDTRVRARPVERGLTGTDGIVTGLDAAAVVNSIDFLKTSNKPFIDFAGENIPVADNVAISSFSNSGTSGSDYDATGSSTSGHPKPFCKDPDAACSQKTVCFDLTGSLKVGVDLSNSGAASHIVGNVNLDPNLSDEPSVGILVLRGGTTITLGEDATFTVSTDASANITDFKVVNGGRGIEAGDVLAVAFEVDGAVTYTVQSNEFNYDFYHSTIDFVTVPTSPDVPFPLADYVIYITFVAPDGALFNPLYSNNIGANSLTETFVSNMGPMPGSSLGNEFEINHGQRVVAPDLSVAYTTSVQSQIFPSLSPGFEYRVDSGDELSSEKNLYTFVIRRAASREIFIYSRDGELIGNRGPNENDDDTKIELRQFGMVLPFNVSNPQIRIARFGIVEKDLGDLLCRNIAVQLQNHYTTTRS